MSRLFSRRLTAEQKYLSALESVNRPKETLEETLKGSSPWEGHEMEMTSAEYAELPQEMTPEEYASMKEGMELMWQTVADMHDKITEMHKFTSGIAQALNNPMLKSMLPPQIRDMM